MNEPHPDTSAEAVESQADLMRRGLAEQARRDSDAKFGLFVQADVSQYAKEVDRAVAELADLVPLAYDGFGAPLYAHQIPAEGTE